MVSSKDQVEAEAFTHRRLVAAFTSGAAGAPEVAPARLLRTLGGGVVLCVLLLAVAAVGGILVPRDPDGGPDGVTGTRSAYPIGAPAQAAPN